MYYYYFLIDELIPFVVFMRVEAVAAGDVVFAVDIFTVPAWAVHILVIVLKQVTAQHWK